MCRKAHGFYTSLAIVAIVCANRYNHQNVVIYIETLYSHMYNDHNS